MSKKEAIKDVASENVGTFLEQFCTYLWKDNHSISEKVITYSVLVFEDTASISFGAPQEFLELLTKALQDFDDNYETPENVSWTASARLYENKL